MRPVVKSAFIFARIVEFLSAMNKMPHCGRLLILISGMASLCVWLAVSVSAQSEPSAYRADRILIKPKAGIIRTALENFHLAQKCVVLRTYDGMGHLQV